MSLAKALSKNKAVRRHFSKNLGEEATPESVGRWMKTTGVDSEDEAVDLISKMNKSKASKAGDLTDVPGTEEFGKSPLLRNPITLKPLSGKQKAAGGLGLVGAGEAFRRSMQDQGIEVPDEEVYPTSLTGEPPAPEPEETMPSYTEEPRPGRTSTASIWKQARKDAEDLRTNVPESEQDLEKTISDSLDNMYDDLPSMDRATFNNKRQELKKVYEAAKNKMEWREVAEMMAQALTQFGAGYYGLKHGVNMSGLTFNRRDWESKLNRLFKEYGLDLDTLEGEERAAQRDVEQKKAQTVEQRKAQYKQRLDDLSRMRRERMDKAGRIEKDALLQIDDARAVDADKLDAWRDAQRARLKEYEAKVRVHLKKMEQGTKEEKEEARKAKKAFDQKKKLIGTWIDANSGSKSAINDMKAIFISAGITDEDRMKDLIEEGPVSGMAKLEGRQQKSPTSVPAKGEVRNGYRFLGGDPTNQSNWEAVQ